MKNLIRSENVEERISVPIYKCRICERVRPDPRLAKDIETLDEWKRYGEGWYVFSNWNRTDKRYLCPICAKLVAHTIDQYAEIGRMGGKKC